MKGILKSIRYTASADLDVRLITPILLIVALIYLLTKTKFSLMFAAPRRGLSPNFA